MSADELLAAYPHCPRAVAWVELTMCVSNRIFDKTAWEILTCPRTDGTVPTPAEVASMIIDDTREECGVETPLRAKCAEAYEQMQHPSFLEYIRWRMGCA